MTRSEKLRAKNGTTKQTNKNEFFVNDGFITPIKAQRHINKNVEIENLVEQIKLSFTLLLIAFKGISNITIYAHN